LKLNHLKPLMSLAKNEKEQDKNLTLIRGYDETGAAKYIVNSTYRPKDQETIGFFYLLENAIKCLAVNAKMENIHYFMAEHPQPLDEPEACLDFIEFVDSLEDEIDRSIRLRVYDEIPESKESDVFENPESDNQKSLGMTKELEKLVDEFVTNLKGNLGLI